MKRPKAPKKTPKYSKGIVALIIVLNVFFSLGVFIVFWHTGSEPERLIEGWFLSMTGELWLISGIKKKKIEKESADEQNRLEEETNL